VLDDPIVEGVRRVREAYAAQFGYDLKAVAADLRRAEGQHPEKLVSYPPNPPTTTDTLGDGR
jgi:hypothetical protein